jgi:hypothetical protein
MTMMTTARALAVAALAAASMAVASVTFAAPCSGFTDVSDSDPFCPSVDWLRNRAVTLGCTSTTVYCPASPVSRLAMAAFMNRLGNALTPVFYYKESSGASLNLATPTVICQTPGIPPGVYPRDAHVGGVLSAQTIGTAMPTVRVVASIDNGATWYGGFPSSGSETNGFVNLTAWQGNFNLLPTTLTYIMGLQVQGSGNLGAWTCQAQAMVVSRTGTSAPY